MNNDIKATLRQAIENKIGKKILHGRDCHELSTIILEKTNRIVSPTTLKRFFEIIKAKNEPSRYTLETLVIFLGYDSWTSFLDSAEASTHKSAGDNTWQLLKQRLQQVTENSMTSMKMKTGFDPEKFLLRANARKRFEAFCTSSKTATMFVGPEGYGKSSTLLQLVDEYFLKPGAKFKDDIICLIDGTIFFHLYTQNSSIEILNQLLEFKLTSSLSYLFNNNPELRKGRVWIIIDDIDEIFVEKEQYHKFSENIMRLILANHENNWSKIILSCRPENMDVFTALAKKNPLFRSCWHNVNFSAASAIETVNIPLFTEFEITSLLKKLDFKYSLDFLKIFHTNIIDVIQYPYFLSILVDVYEEDKPISEIILLNRFVEKRLHSEPCRDDKIVLVDKFLDLCEWGKKSNAVKKADLLDKDLKHGYQELIAHGLIYEYIRPDDGIMNHFVYVKFCQNVIFEFILTDRWLNGKPLNLDIINQIKDFYQKNDPLRCRIIQLLTMVLLYNEDYKTIVLLHQEYDKSIDSSINSIAELPKCIVSSSDVIRKSMRSQKTCRDFLIPNLAKTRIGQILYFEEAFDIDSIVIASWDVLSAYNNRQPPLSDAFSHYMQFFKGFLTQDKELFEYEYSKTEDIDWNNIFNPWISSCKYKVQIIFNTYINPSSIQHLLPEIKVRAKYFLHNKIQTTDELPEFELSIIETLNLCKRYDEIIDLSDFVENHYDSSLMEGSPFYQYSSLCLSRALLHNNEKAKAWQIFNNIVNLQFPDHMKYYMKINIDLIHVDFLLDSNKTEEVFELTGQIKHFSNLLKFKYFYSEAERLEKMISVRSE